MHEHMHAKSTRIVVIGSGGRLEGDLVARLAPVYQVIGIERKRC